MMRMVMLVVVGGCSLFSLVTAGLALNSGQPGSAVFFGLFGLFFGGLAVATIRKKTVGGTDGADPGSQSSVFVPHWFVMTALLLTAAAVVGSMLWRLVR